MGSTQRRLAGAVDEIVPQQMDQLDDPELIRRWQTGDSDAFRALAARHSRTLFGTAYLMTRDRCLAEDTAQEVLFRVWRGLRTFDPRRGSFKAWLLRILLNEVRQVKRRRRHAEVPLDEAEVLAIDPDDPCEALQRQSDRDRVRRGLLLLPEEQRQLLVLRFFADLTVPEIATALGWREGTVKSRLHRSLARLRSILTAED